MNGKTTFMSLNPLNKNIVNEVVKRLVKTYDPLEIYLLEAGYENTIDNAILVIVEGNDIPHYKLMTKGHKALIGVDIAKSILVYTKEEFADYSQDTATLSYLIKRDGKRIYAKI